MDRFDIAVDSAARWPRGWHRGTMRRPGVNVHMEWIETEIWTSPDRLADLRL